MVDSIYDQSPINQLTPAQQKQLEEAKKIHEVSLKNWFKNVDYVAKKLGVEPIQHPAEEIWCIKGGDGTNPAKMYNLADVLVALVDRLEACSCNKVTKAVGKMSNAEGMVV